MGRKLFKFCGHLIRVKMYGQMNVNWFSAGHRKMWRTYGHWKKDFNKQWVGLQGQSKVEDRQKCRLGTVRPHKAIITIIIIIIIDNNIELLLNGSVLSTRFCNGTSPTSTIQGCRVSAYMPVYSSYTSGRLYLLSGITDLHNRTCDIVLYT